MNAISLSVIVSRVDGTLYTGDAVSVSVPSIEGEMVVLAHHEPLIALLGKGVVRVRLTVSHVKEFNIESGLIEISNNHATILV